MKKIVHFQIPYNKETGNLLFSTDKVRMFYDYLKEILKDDYHILITPMCPVDTEYLTNISLEELNSISWDVWREFIDGRTRK